VADDETYEVELALATPDAAAPLARTASIVLPASTALAAAQAYEEQAAAVAAADAEAAVPPLPIEVAPRSLHAKWYARPPRAVRAYRVVARQASRLDRAGTRARRSLEARIAAPISDGPRHVPVISRQGGVGASTVTTLLGMALADVRDDRVLAIDANPDLPVLAGMVEQDSPLEVRGRSALLHGTEDCAVVLTDGATGVHDSTMGAALRRADCVVLVSGGTSEQARMASATVSWMEENDLGELAHNTVVALNTATPGTRYESLDAIEAHFQARVRDVVRIPYDEELTAGTPVRYGALRPDTRDAARDLAAKVMDGIPRERAA
jgi:MinD-like ATPase involved in chromosome partitioning or flagellar assembly